MSDRIDTMAAALIAALGAYGTVHDAGDGWTTLTLHHDDMPRIARRLLAAMQAEPTEAELDQAIHNLVIAAMESADASDGDIGSVTRIVAEQRLRALIPTRKACS